MEQNLRFGKNMKNISENDLFKRISKNIKATTICFKIESIIDFIFNIILFFGLIMYCIYLKRFAYEFMLFDISIIIAMIYLSIYEKRIIIPGILFIKRDSDILKLSQVPPALNGYTDNNLYKQQLTKTLRHYFYCTIPISFLYIIIFTLSFAVYSGKSNSGLLIYSLFLFLCALPNILSSIFSYYVFCLIEKDEKYIEYTNSKSNFIDNDCKKNQKQFENSNSNVKNLLAQTGKKFFIKYYNQLKSWNPVDISDCITENYSDETKNQRIKNGKKIFEKGLEILALKAVLNDTDGVIDNETKTLAQNIYNDETNEIIKQADVNFFIEYYYESKTMSVTEIMIEYHDTSYDLKTFKNKLNNNFKIFSCALNKTLLEKAISSPDLSIKTKQTAQEIYFKEFGKKIETE